MPTDKYLSRQTDLNRQARQLLIDLLAGGTQPYSTIHERAQEQGIPLWTLLTVKRALNSQSRKSDGHVIWQLRKAA